MENKGVFQFEIIIMSHLAFSAPFEYLYCSMGPRPLEFVDSFSVGIVFGRQCLTSDSDVKKRCMC